MTTLSGSPKDFGAFLRRMGAALPAAVERGLREGAMIIQAKATELTPVDQGQMKASWRVVPVDGGALVVNGAGHAVFVERGRGPGPVPAGPILAWMRRHGIDEGALHAILKKLSSSGYEPRWPLKKAVVASRGPIRRAIEAQIASVR